MAPSADDRIPPSRGGPSGDTEPVSAQREVTPTAVGRAPTARRYLDDGGQAFETDRYCGLEEIGRGGSSVVIRALDKELLRHVAIKILDPAVHPDGSLVDRFAEEARISAQLDHPNIVPIYELGVDARGLRFLAMKLVQGETLDGALDRLGDERLEPARLAELLQVFVKVCDAVSFAHSRGVLHRDLKPKNVMLGDFGQVYVVDWGIARLRAGQAQAGSPRVRLAADEGEADTVDRDPKGVLVGTAFYMGPEQLLGQHDLVDQRSDVFALGATLYQILTQRPPLTPETLRAIRLRKPPPAIVPPDLAVTGSRIPPELARIAMRAIAFDPSERYPSVADLKRDVEAFQRGAWDLPRVRMDAGSLIVREGETGDAAYVVLEGTCVAFRDDDQGGEVELRVMGPGDVFGEMAVFSRKPRSASVRAATEVRLLVVTGDVLSKAIGLNSWTGAFVRALADRFREADQRLRALERVPASSPFGEGSPRTPVGHGDRVPRSHKEWFQRAAAELPRRSAPAGAVLVTEGQPATASFIVLDGRCVESRIDGDAETVIRELGPGDVIGELAIVPTTDPYRVRAGSDVELLVVEPDAVWATLRGQSWVALFVRALADRLREATERLRSPDRR